ncbi:MAG: PQQ-binding-like beta-propeller repeat protein [Verrucomicrobia bacterium]|nr:PQQ-binding-like beta-propeller repeat protein [Verrucomicrobiota bacterium]
MSRKDRAVVRAGLVKISSVSIHLSVVLATLLMAGKGEAAKDWPQFRGPRGDGSATTKNLPLVWSKTNNIAWKSPVPGRGRSSPVVLDDHIWLTLAIEQGALRTRIGPDDMQTAEHITLKAVCLDRSSGKIVWESTLFEVDKPAPVHWLNSWATPTPVVEPGRLYCDFGTFGTACVDSQTGQVLWQKRLALDHQVGPGSSPVLWQNLLLLVRDGRDAQYVTALDKKTGQTVWKTDRPPIDTPSTDLRKAFSTPLLIQSGGHTQMIAPTAHWIVSYDPGTGKEFWRARHGQGFSFGSCPVFGKGMAFFSTGCFKAQLWAIRVDGEGDVTSTHIAWKCPRQVPVMSSPVLAGSELYWVSDDGMASCADAQSGAVHWQERLGGTYLASPLYAAGRIYFFGMDGKTTVVKAGKQFERLAENFVQGPLVATPALLDQSIFLRTDTHLYRIGKP